MNSALLKGLILHLCKVKINPETDSNKQKVGSWHNYFYQTGSFIGHINDIHNARRKHIFENKKPQLIIGNENINLNYKQFMAFYLQINLVRQGGQQLFNRIFCIFKLIMQNLVAYQRSCMYGNSHFVLMNIILHSWFYVQYIFGTDWYSQIHVITWAAACAKNYIIC